MRPRLLLCLLFTLLPATARAADEIHWTFTGPTSVTFDWRGTESSVRYGLTSLYGNSVSAATPSPLPPSSRGVSDLLRGASARVVKPPASPSCT